MTLKFLYNIFNFKPKTETLWLYTDIIIFYTTFVLCTVIKETDLENVTENIQYNVFICIPVPHKSVSK